MPNRLETPKTRYKQGILGMRLSKLGPQLKKRQGPDPADFQALLGRLVDVLTEAAIHRDLCTLILAEAVPPTSSRSSLDADPT